MIDFYKINKESKLETVSYYYLMHDENGNLTIYDGPDYNHKSEYTTKEELISANVKDAKAIDITTLTFKKFK